MVYVSLDPREVTDFNSIRRITDEVFVRIYPEKVKELLKDGYKSCCKSEYGKVLAIVKRRFEIDISIPQTASKHVLRTGDQVVIIVLEKIRKLGYEEMYTDEELRKSRVIFRLYTIK
ncbi:MAG: hypothetical protein KBC81_01845 [Candidatus Pacebacteria bacterium]|nr:hypothetical protein [Candidatus Paceibacterota bacterium]